MNKGENIILVTGATGQQGGAVARQLLSRGHKVRALTRKPQGAAAMALSKLGAEVIQGNLDDPLSIERALTDICGVFAVQNTWEAGIEREEEHGKRLAEIAKKKNVQTFVYTSVDSVHRNTGIPHFDNKWRIEERVRQVGFPFYTILRPVFFMDNFTSASFKSGLKEGKLMIGIKPNTVLQMIAVEDIGEFGARAFGKHQEMNGREIDLAGDQHTMSAVAEILSKVMGKKIQFIQVPLEVVRKFSNDLAIMLEWFDRVGFNANISRLTKDYGIRLTTLAEWASKANWR